MAQYLLGRRPISGRLLTERRYCVLMVDHSVEGSCGHFSWSRCRAGGDLLAWTDCESKYQ